MTNVLKQESVKYFEWNVRTPAEYDTRVISESFLYQDCSYNLEFYVNTFDGKSYLYFKSSKKLQSALKVTVNVLSFSESIIDHLKISITEKDQNIWTHTEALLSSNLTFELIFPADCSKVDKFQDIASPKDYDKLMRSRNLRKDECIQTKPCMNPEVSMESLFENFSQMLETGSYHDVEIKCGEHSINAHKIVLSTRSSVFRVMLQKDALKAQNKVIEVQDVDVNHFQDFIRYLYTNKKPKLTFDKAKALYKAGHIYDIQSLTLCCSKYLQNNLSPENAYECYNLADAHSDQILKDTVKTYLSEKKKKTPFVPVML